MRNVHSVLHMTMTVSSCLNLCFSLRIYKCGEISYDFATSILSDVLRERSADFPGYYC